MNIEQIIIGYFLIGLVLVITDRLYLTKAPFEMIKWVSELIIWPIPLIAVVIEYLKTHKL